MQAGQGPPRDGTGNFSTAAVFGGNVGRDSNRKCTPLFCREARRLRPEISFGADMIAGFPTETEEMSAQNASLAEECGIAHLHVFPYSPRSGTPAARMPQVDRAAVKERAARLREAGKKLHLAHI